MRNQNWKNKKSMTKWVLKIQKYQCRSDKRLQGADSTNVKVFVYGVILVRIFPAFSLIRTKYGEILCISPYSVRMRENAGKMLTRITPNMDTFYVVIFSAVQISSGKSKCSWVFMLHKYMCVHKITP